MRLSKIGGAVMGLLALLGAAGCAADAPPTGATEDRSAHHASPVVIKSDEINSFRLRFETSGIYDSNAQKERYPGGRYDLLLERTESGARCVLQYDSEGVPPRRAEFAAPASALESLDALLKEHDTAQIDGHWKRNTALGCNFDFSVQYADGEKISAYGEGGASVLPDVKYYREEWFLDFFRDLAREYGKDVFAPRVLQCTYQLYGGDGESFYELTLRRAGDENILDVIRRVEKDAEEERREQSIAEEKFEELEQMIGRFHLSAWRKAPPAKTRTPGADIPILVITMEDGEDFGIYAGNKIPPAAFAAMNEVRDFLESLDTQKKLDTKRGERDG